MLSNENNEQNENNTHESCATLDTVERERERERERESLSKD